MTQVPTVPVDEMTARLEASTSPAAGTFRRNRTTIVPAGQAGTDPVQVLEFSTGRAAEQANAVFDATCGRPEVTASWAPSWSRPDPNQPDRLVSSHGQYA